MFATTSLGSFVVNLGNLANIPPDKGRVFQVGGRSIAIFRTADSSVLATDPGHDRGTSKTYPVTVNEQGDILLGVEELWRRR